MLNCSTAQNLKKSDAFRVCGDGRWWMEWSVLTVDWLHKHLLVAGSWLFCIGRKLQTWQLLWKWHISPWLLTKIVFLKIQDNSLLCFFFLCSSDLGKKTDALGLNTERKLTFYYLVMKIWWKKWKDDREIIFNNFAKDKQDVQKHALPFGHWNCASGSSNWQQGIIWGQEASRVWPWRKNLKEVAVLREQTKLTVCFLSLWRRQMVVKG